MGNKVTIEELHSFQRIREICKRLIYKGTLANRDAEKLSEAVWGGYTADHGIGKTATIREIAGQGWEIKTVTLPAPDELILTDDERSLIIGRRTYHAMINKQD